MYSVDTEAEARQLLIAACPRNIAGDFYARELSEEQTFENLAAFSQRLADTHSSMKANQMENTTQANQSDLPNVTTTQKPITAQSDLITIAPRQPTGERAHAPAKLSNGWWGVVRSGRIVQHGIKSRSDAREAARRLNGERPCAD